MKLKTLNGIAHNILHHAMSGVSYLHPHLGHICKQSNVDHVILDLTKESPLSEDLQNYKPAQLASHALHQKFLEMLSIANLPLDSVASATLMFRFHTNDPWKYSGISQIVSKTGTKYAHSMSTDDFIK